jgi:ribosomal protein S27AE
MSEVETDGIRQVHELCPGCGASTGLVKLGSEPAREICGRFGCPWDGVTL